MICRLSSVDPHDDQGLHISTPLMKDTLDRPGQGLPLVERRGHKADARSISHARHQDGLRRAEADTGTATRPAHGSSVRQLPDQRCEA